ncbi:hypothetical protein GCM10017764_13370 [Sphingobacterium griseoflavum]|uniref:DUF3810 domain-containing protein n=2 Tax=Sphingobacterium griseoflavum TaxID=1474952 RepID=A0ABQ3HTB4_9SPHI|nr:hypothetical protein GCM10017764_13370 [Sphingobacterium griseoflavum]
MFLLELLKQYPGAVEQYYSQGFYPWFSYLPKWLVGWIPFSVGDLFYIVALLSFLFLLVRAIVRLSRRQWQGAWLCALRVFTCSVLLYGYFYVSWGMNYYRIPLQVQLQLQVDSLDQHDYLDILDRYIDTLNKLRAQIDTTALDRAHVQEELATMMKQKVEFLPMLSRTQVRAKNPLSSEMVSYFTVTGYLNPFTQEVQVNAVAPSTSYPFTVVHELAHQMGIGFEDECNFIAFLALHDHSNLRYRYAAYYETVAYLLRPLYFQDEQQYRAYANKLTGAVKKDYLVDRLFWQRYRGPVDRLMGFFYGNYLKHNNQPEGVARYSLMSRLVVAWDKSHPVE